MSVYTVIVGNVGVVWEGQAEQTAYAEYWSWICVSENATHSRAFGMDVTLICDGDIVMVNGLEPIS